MKGTPYEGWFTPAERARYEEVIARPDREPTLFRGTKRLAMNLARELVRERLPTSVITERTGLGSTAIHRLRKSTPATPTYTLHDWYVARMRRRRREVTP